MVTPMDSPVQNCPNKGQGDETKKKHWARFKVIDKDNNTPMEGVHVDIDLSDGSNRINATNEKGTAIPYLLSNHIKLFKWVIHYIL